MPKLTNEEYINRVWSTIQKIAKLPAVRKAIIDVYNIQEKQTQINKVILNKKSKLTVRECARKIHNAFVIVCKNRAQTKGPN